MHSRPVLRGLFQFNARLFRLVLRIERGIKRLLPRPHGDIPDSLTDLDLSRGVRVLIIAEDRIPQCYRYRVQQKLDQLSITGVDAKAIAWTEAVYHPELADFYHVVIFYRTPGYPHVLDLIHDVRAKGKLVFYETDDIIFDADIQREVIESSHRQISKKLQKQVLDGAKYYLAAMKACPFAIASTSSLAEQMERHLGEGRVAVSPNGLDEPSLNAAAQNKPEREKGSIRLFYGSGTRTHDADLDMIAPALAEIMVRHPNVRLVLVGYISVPDALRAMQDRIDQLPLLDASNYMHALRYADINLAPLLPGVFSDSKSEIKWLEAAVLAIPSVVSPTRTFREVVVQGRSGMLADSVDDWVNKLSELIEDESLRSDIGRAAKQVAMVKYQPADLGKRLVRNILSSAEKAGAKVSADHKTACVIGDDPSSLRDMIGNLAERIRVLNPLASEYSALTEYLKYAKPHCLLITGIVSDAVTHDVLESGIPHIMLIRDTKWLSGGDANVEASENLAQEDPIRLASIVSDLNCVLNSRERLKVLADYAKAVLAESEELAALYSAAGIQCDTYEAKLLASLLESSDKTDTE